MILARAMAQADSVQAGFDRYENTRRPRTALIHDKSAEQGRLTQDINPDRYDGATAPAGDEGILGYDPVTAELM
jgi:2-polyprenyl-6-methoxyphenol hydroxylase-like FAD-dependent oxidoreductase